MPIKVEELTPLQDRIMTLLSENSYMAFSSKEIATYLDIAHSTARKHLNQIFKRGLVNRGKQKDYNRTFFYHI